MAPIRGQLEITIRRTPIGRRPTTLFQVDTEAPRFLDFETWGQPGPAQCGEMVDADNLFVGNKLSSGEIRTSDGGRVDLRNIKSPIIGCARGRQHHAAAAGAG